jgi:uncharacterized protein (DUF433 family)
MAATTRIVKTPEVLHGKPRVEGTRVGVFQVGYRIRERSRSIADVADRYGLDRAQVEAALDYYDDHPELIETLAAQHEAGLQSIAAESRAE